MRGEVNPVPEGFHTVTPYVMIGGAYEAIEFYKEAFGAEEMSQCVSAQPLAISHQLIVFG